MLETVYSLAGFAEKCDATYYHDIEDSPGQAQLLTKSARSNASTIRFGQLAMPEKRKKKKDAHT